MNKSSFNKLIYSYEQVKCFSEVVELIKSSDRLEDKITEEAKNKTSYCHSIYPEHTKVVNFITKIFKEIGQGEDSRYTSLLPVTISKGNCFIDALNYGYQSIETIEQTTNETETSEKTVNYYIALDNYNQLIEKTYNCIKEYPKLTFIDYDLLTAYKEFTINFHGVIEQIDILKAEIAIS